MIIIKIKSEKLIATKRSMELIAANKSPVKVTCIGRLTLLLSNR